jgi:hypothetical protein
MVAIVSAGERGEEKGVQVGCAQADDKDAAGMAWLLSTQPPFAQKPCRQCCNKEDAVNGKTSPTIW